MEAWTDWDNVLYRMDDYTAMASKTSRCVWAMEDILDWDGGESCFVQLLDICDETLVSVGFEFLTGCAELNKGVDWVRLYARDDAK